MPTIRFYFHPVSDAYIFEMHGFFPVLPDPAPYPRPFYWSQMGLATGSYGYVVWKVVSYTGWNEPWTYPTNFFGKPIGGDYPDWIYRKAFWITQGQVLHDALVAEDCDRIAAGTWTFVLYYSCTVSNQAVRKIRLEIYLRSGEDETLLFTEITNDLKTYDDPYPLVFTTAPQQAFAVTANDRLVIKAFFEKTPFPPYDDGANYIRMGQQGQTPTHSYVEFPVDETPASLFLAKGWTIGNVEIRDNNFQAELRGRAQRLQHRLLELYTPGCRATLGDARCGVDLDDSAGTYQYSGVVSSVTEGQRKFIDDSIGSSIAEESLRFGLLTWSTPGSGDTYTGSNAGYQMEIKKFDGETMEFELFQGMPYTIEVDDEFTLVWGCDKSVETCRDIYDNLVNFRGEPFVPAASEVITVRVVSHGGGK